MAAGLGGLAVGAVAWAALWGPAARALPGGLAVPERMAAATLGMDRWRAGKRMMGSANPNGWRRLAGDTQLTTDDAGDLRLPQGGRQRRARAAVRDPGRADANSRERQGS